MARDDDVDCVEAVHVLYQYLDGEIAVERQVSVQRHLEACMPCLEAFDFEAELRMVIARRCSEQVPDTLRQRIARAIRHAAGEEGMLPE